MLCFAQPVLNERYQIDDATNAIFGSVIATDSCYYIGGMHTSSPSISESKGSFIKLSFDGTIINLSTIDKDTMGIDMWQGNNLIETLDGKFVCMAQTKGENSYIGFTLVKISPSGDTIWTRYFYDFFLENEEFGIRPSKLMQDIDSSYYGLLAVQRLSDLEGGTVFYRLDKNGNLMYSNTFYQTGFYNPLKPGGLVKTSDTTFLISTTMSHSDFDPEDTRYFTKLIEVDTLGDFIAEHIIYEDSLALDCNGLIQTEDGGFLYCGRKGYYDIEDDVIAYKPQVVKLNSNFELDWSKEFGNYRIAFDRAGMTKILAINDSEFVAVGNTYGKSDFSGCLIKFNNSGDKIWERYYVKVPHYEGETNWASHELYDVEQTVDGGFVMVGQAVNYHENPEPYGQMGWLVKTNPYGCIVPGCQFGDIPADAEPKDTSIMNPPLPEEPITMLYPNPATESIFYYHHQDSFNFGTVYIYNSAGQRVHKWDIKVNDITYEIDISDFAAGQYILQVLDADGKLIEVERFVKR